jgi:ABC transporter ATP-binding protein (multidrug resistance protein)
MSIGYLSDCLLKNDGASEKINGFIIIVVLVVLTNIISNGLASVKMYVESMFAEQIQVKIKSDIMKKASELEMKYFDSPEFYDMLGDINYNSNIISKMVFVVFDFVQIFIQLIFAFFKVWIWKWYAPIIVLLTSVPSLIIKNRQYNSEYIFQKDNMKYDRQMFYLSGIAFSREYAQDVKIYNLFPELNKKFIRIWKEMFGKKRKLVKKYTILVIILECLPAIVTGIFMVFLGILVIKKQINFEEFSYLNGLIGQLSMFALGTITRYSSIFDSEIRIKNLMKFINIKSDSSNGDKIEFNEEYFTLEFNDVYFRYDPASDYVLKGINFKIKSNEKIALVGVNGCGKTSIIKLILRFYEPDKGCILLNGKDIKLYSEESVRSLFSPMFQNYNNYAFTAKEDIILSDLENKQSMDEIIAAAAQSGADLFINRFDDGYDTYLTRQFEDGVELSGGQWQKIALSRTIFRNPVMYILDEPSSALDAQSEDELFAHFNELFRSKGAILVSHRLSNVKNCNKIIVIDNGVVVEEGTHEQLMSNYNKYAYMFNLQANKYK